MSKESEFFIYLIERYAAYKKSTADQILQLLTHSGLLDQVYEMYEIYHSERLQNAFEDLDQMIQEQFCNTSSV